MYTSWKFKFIIWGLLPQRAERRTWNKRRNSYQFTRHSYYTRWFRATPLSCIFILFPLSQNSSGSFIKGYKVRLLSQGGQNCKATTFTGKVGFWGPIPAKSAIFQGRWRGGGRNGSRSTSSWSWGRRGGSRAAAPSPRPWPSPCRRIKGSSPAPCASPAPFPPPRTRTPSTSRSPLRCSSPESGDGDVVARSDVRWWRMRPRAL